MSHFHKSMHMEPRTRLALLLIASLVHSVTAIGEPPPDEPGIHELFSTYYLEKDAAALPDFLKRVQESNFLEANDSAAGPVSAFLSVIFEANPEKAESLARSTVFTGKTKEVVATALWRSGNGRKIKPVFGETPAFALAPPINLRAMPITRPEDLDMMWGAFLASGDVAYVNRIIDVLDVNRPLAGDAMTDQLTRGAAEWSLKSNMMQHELVHRLIRKEAKSRKDPVQAKLRTMLESIKHTHFPDRDGPFSAKLIVVDEKSMAELEKPVDKVPKLSALESAQRGEVLGVVVLFTGLELSDDLRADVRYDLKILGPDGTVSDKTDLKNLKGVVRKMPTRFRVFHNDEVVRFRFEPEHEVGTYQFIARVRDDMGGKSVSLKAEIVLSE